MYTEPTTHPGGPVCVEPRCPRFRQPEYGGFCTSCGRSTSLVQDLPVVPQQYYVPVSESYAGAMGMPGDPAGLGRRVLARLIDSVVLVAPLVILGLIAANSPDAAGVATGTERSPGAADATFGVLLLAWYLLPLFYEFVMLATFRGQTLGKAIMMVKVVRLDGRPIGFGAAAGRVYVQLLVSALTCGFGGFLFAISPLFDPGAWRRGWPDRIASTVVIRADR
jgi:uncharacterized RDD family membrane protein YckC